MANIKVIQFQLKSGEAPSPTNLATELENAASVIRAKGLLDGEMVTAPGKWAVGVAVLDSVTKTVKWEGVTVRDAKNLEISKV
jgi:hypothetical protein